MKLINSHDNGLRFYWNGTWANFAKSIALMYNMLFIIQWLLILNMYDDFPVTPFLNHDNDSFKRQKWYSNESLLIAKVTFSNRFWQSMLSFNN